MATRIVIFTRTTTVTVSVEVDAEVSKYDREAYAREEIDANGWQRYAHADEQTTLTLQGID
jgi:hypothetical protein